LTFFIIFVKIDYRKHLFGGEIIWQLKNVNIVIIGKVITLQQKLIATKLENIKNTMMIVIAENMQKNKYNKKYT